MRPGPCGIPCLFRAPADRLTRPRCGAGAGGAGRVEETQSCGARAELEVRNTAQRPTRTAHMRTTAPGGGAAAEEIPTCTCADVAGHLPTVLVPVSAWQRISCSQNKPLCSAANGARRSMDCPPYLQGWLGFSIAPAREYWRWLGGGGRSAEIFPWHVAAEHCVFVGYVRVGWRPDAAGHACSRSRSRW